MQANKPKVVNDPTVKWISDHWYPGPEAPAGVPAFGFLSIPFDYAVSYRAGTRFGPQAILEALNGYSLYCPDKRVSLENTAWIDLGAPDIVHSLQESYRNIRETVARIPGQITPILLGGDHSITDPIIRGMQDRLSEKRFGLVVFDAHYDSRDPIPGKEHSGNWMKTLEDVLDYRTAVQLGINACIYSKHYMDDAEQKGVLVRTPYDIRKGGWDAVIRETVAHAMEGTEGIYISVDIDSINQAFAPGTSVANPGGLYPQDIIDAVFEMSLAAPIVGLDITEVSPPLDPHNFTAQVAAQIVINFIAGTVKRLDN